MTLKIEKYADEYSTTIRLIGRVQAVTTFGGTEDADRGERTKARDGLGRSGLGRRGGCSVPRTCKAQGVKHNWIGKERDLSKGQDLRP